MIRYELYDIIIIINNTCFVFIIIINWFNKTRVWHHIPCNYLHTYHSDIYNLVIIKKIFIQNTKNGNFSSHIECSLPSRWYCNIPKILNNENNNNLLTLSSSNVDWFIIIMLYVNQHQYITITIYTKEKQMKLCLQMNILVTWRDLLLLMQYYYKYSIKQCVHAYYNLFRWHVFSYVYRRNGWVGCIQSS